MRPHLSERMCVREKRATEMRMKAVSQVTRALIRWRYTAQHTSTGGTVTCQTSNIAYRSKVDQSPNFLCNNRTNYFSKKSHTLLSCWPDFSSRFAVRRMWRLRIFPAITQMTCVNKIKNTIYLEFQLLLFPAGTPPRGKILFLSLKIRFPFYFLNLQNKPTLSQQREKRVCKKASWHFLHIFLEEGMNVSKI